MQRSAASAAFSALAKAPTATGEQRAAFDVAALLTAARGAPPVICARVAERSWNGWGDRRRAERRRSGRVASTRYEIVGATRLSDAEGAAAARRLSSDDACVRELSVRLVGIKNDKRVARAHRASTRRPALRAVAALGLGLAEPPKAVDPLVSTLRDAMPACARTPRGRSDEFENGRALARSRAFSGTTPIGARSRGVAVGRLDSDGAVASLLRVLQQDDSPRVRRVAAWALGHSSRARRSRRSVGARSRQRPERARDDGVGARQHRARAKVRSCSARAQQDADDAVRETFVWALAQIEDERRRALGAAANDKSTRVRGTAAWAIGQLRTKTALRRRDLCTLLKDESEDTRRKAAWALGQIGDACTAGDPRRASGAEHRGAPRARARTDEIRGTVGGSVQGAALRRSEGARDRGTRTRGEQLVQSVAVALAASSALSVRSDNAHIQTFTHSSTTDDGSNHVQRTAAFRRACAQGADRLRNGSALCPRLGLG